VFGFNLNLLGLILFCFESTGGMPVFVDLSLEGLLATWTCPVIQISENKHARQKTRLGLRIPLYMAGRMLLPGTNPIF